MYEKLTTHKFSINKEDLVEMIKFYSVSHGFKWPVGKESLFTAAGTTYLSVECKQEEGEDGFN